MGGVDEYCTLTLLKAVHHMANAPRLVLLLAQGKVIVTPHENNAPPKFPIWQKGSGDSCGELPWNETCG